jgi:hypothetical protein
MDFFDILIGAVSVALVPLGWYVKSVSSRINEVERVNDQQKDALHRLELTLATNHPDNSDLDRLNGAMRELTSAVNTLTTKFEVFVSRHG